MTTGVLQVVPWLIDLVKYMSTLAWPPGQFVVSK
jgi:hypothetical protein